MAILQTKASAARNSRKSIGMNKMISARKMEVDKCYRLKCYNATYKVRVTSTQEGGVMGHFKNKQHSKPYYLEHTSHGYFIFGEMDIKVLPIKSL